MRGATSCNVVKLKHVANALALRYGPEAQIQVKVKWEKGGGARQLLHVWCEGDVFEEVAENVISDAGQTFTFESEYTSPLEVFVPKQGW